MTCMGLHVTGILGCSNIIAKSVLDESMQDRQTGL
jgi:hypothetical protein